MTSQFHGIVAGARSDLLRSGAARAEVAAALWNAPLDAVLWASPAVAALAASVVDRRSALPAPARARLQALAGGLAPVAGLRLERLRLGSALMPPEVVAFRRVAWDGGDGLLAVFPARPDMGGSALEAAPVLRRFVWMADPNGRIRSVSPEPSGFAEVGGWTGRLWDEVLVALVAGGEDDPAAEPLLDGGGWTERSFVWRAAAPGSLLPVVITAMPVIAPSGDLEAFRGSVVVGTAIPAETSQPAAETDVDKPASLDHPDEAPALGSPVTPPTESAPAVEEGVPDVHEMAAPLSDEAPPMRLPRAGAFAVLGGRADAQFGDRVLPLRRVEPEDVVSVSAGEAGAGPLSFSERGALHEIARVLGARLETGDAEPLAASRPSAEIVALPTRAREPDLARFAERLPDPILIFRGAQPVFANRAFLDLTGDADLVSLVARGDVPPRTGGPVYLSHRGGGTRRLHAAVTDIEWGDAPAALVTFRPAAAVGADVEPRVAPALREGSGAAQRIAALGSVSIDGLGRILALNDVAESLLGFGQNEVAGEGFVTLFAPASHHAAIALVDGARDGAGSVDAPLLIRSASGAPVPVEARAGLAEDGAVMLVWRPAGSRPAVSAPDASPVSDAEVLARVSHEIRTPLTAMIGFAEIMLEERFGPVGNERYKAYLKDIRVSGEHVLSLVNDFLDLAKLHAGENRLSFTSFDLNAVVGQSVALLQPSASRERIVMRTSFADKLPRVVADERSIRQVALNVLSNAIRYTGAGGQVIVSTARTDRGEMAFRVRDTGVGMTEEEVQAALTPFRQVSSTQRSDGTGLGLPLSKALVEANQGAFSISSSRRGGTLVEVVFPQSRVLAE